MEWLVGESSSTVPWLLVATLLGHTPAQHERHDELPHQLLRLPWLMHPLQPGSNVGVCEHELVGGSRQGLLPWWLPWTLCLMLILLLF